MADITEIVPGAVWTGGAITNDADVDQLVGAGIDADIDLRMMDDRSVDPFLPNAGEKLALHPDIKYLHNGTPDDGEPKPVSWFKRSWTFAEPILRNGETLLAHCANGHNRGPSTAYFIIRAFYGMSGDDAFDLIVERRPVAKVRYRLDADEALIALGLA